MIRMKPSFRLAAMAGIATTAAVLTGCFGEDGPSAAEKKDSKSASTAATQNLGTAMGAMTNFDQYEYGREDLTSLRTANVDFRKAIKLDPGNRQARLGAAVTGVLLAAQSDRLSKVVNQTLEADSPFDVSFVSDAPMAKGAVMQRISAAAEFPEFHEIQDAVADTLLPALDEAIANLRSVVADPAFSMTLTVDDRAIEIDHAEASVLLAGFLGIKGLATLYLARDIDIDIDGSYDYIQDLEGIGEVENFSDLTDAQEAAFNKLAGLLKPGSNFLGVRAGWKDRLALVDDHIKEALSVAKSGLNSIKTETDDQEDDLLRLCSATIDYPCIQSEALTEGLTAVDTALKYLSQPYKLEIPDLDTTISVNFAAYFNIQDYKKLLPWYGFYDATEWSDEKPVLYFNNGQGVVTGNIKTLQDLGDRADLEGWTAVKSVDELKKIIHFQDPTFQGLLPGATEAGIWNLIRKAAAREDAQTPIAKRAASYMGPRLALDLLGKR